MNKESDGMKRPTATEIQRQVAGLRVLKPRVLRRSMFNDDHHAAIDAQVEVLEDDLTEDAIYNRSDEDAEGWPDNVRDAALAARQWLDGEYEDYPDLVDSWK